MGLTKVAITRPVFILMVMLLCILGGLHSYQGMRKEQNPDVSSGIVTIVTSYPGAGPDEINTLVSKKIEDGVSGVNNLIEITSTSQEGVSIVTCQFEVGTDVNVALADVRSKIDSTVNDLPKDALKPTVSKVDFSSAAVLTLDVSSDKMNRQQLRDLVDEKVKDRFGEIAGVSSVRVYGGDVREIQVRLRKEKLLAYGLGIGDVQRALAASTLNAPSGKQVIKDSETSVRVLGEFKTVEDIANMKLSVATPSSTGSKNTTLTLSDVASVVDTVVERTSYTSLNGEDAITVSIQRAKEGNAVEIAQACRKLEPEIAKEYGLTFIETFDDSKSIINSLDDLTLTLVLGVLLVGGIVYLFLHNFRGTMIVAIAIPVCLLATITLMDLYGFTINSLSMLALSLAIGVLVDDAIVVLENIYRHLRMGEKPVEAAINGRAEIGLAAIAITMADVVVFVPVGLMGGIVGQFFRPLGLGFATCVFLSLMVSFTITPMLASRWYREGEDLEHPTGKFAQWFDRRFDALSHSYANTLEWALNHRLPVFFGGFVVLIAVFMGIGGSFAPSIPEALAIGSGPAKMAIFLGLIGGISSLLRRKSFFGTFGIALAFAAVFPLAAVGGYLYKNSYKHDSLFKFEFFPQSDSGKVSITIQLPPGSSLEATGKVAKRVEQIVMKHPDAKYTVTRVGSKGGGFSSADNGSQYAQIDVTLNDKIAPLEKFSFGHKSHEKTRTKSDQSAAADMIEMVGRVPGADVTIAASGAQGFGSAIQISFRSDDRELLASSVTKIAERLRSGVIPGVINVDTSSKPGKPELRLIPDRPRLASTGLTVSDVSSAMRTLYQGNNDTKFRVNGKEYDIRVMMDYIDRDNPDALSQVPLKFVGDQPVFPTSVGKLVAATNLDKVERRARQEEIRITTDLLPGYAAGSIQTQIDKLIADEKLLPDKVKEKPLGQADAQSRNMGYLLTALFTGLILVYMLLASLYDNLLYPFIIQLAQPQALVGALLALVLTDKSLNIVGFIGIIALVGLVGKNAILLVDYANTLRSRGESRHDALVESGRTRLRPIAMTTTAVILGMLPVALAIGRGSEFRETIGIIIIGGVSLSTILTLLVIPCSYTIFDDISASLGRLLARTAKK